ncbi:hypothetical protein LNQ81_10720 [Myroides sp. M-43]|uniref:hypothetical protein n=1 Tax=Myroides oncorhynchi TaxID=2893756 RepID=UPI001E310664|nr:hypothetical protein [Myroides oncorhynchi]MCC9043146.1 hypothetical protein [Myroides oncorhynchi]
MRRVGTGIFVIGLLLIGCKKEGKSIVNEIVVVEDGLKSDNVEVLGKFEEGALTYQMSFSDTIVDEFIRAISEDPLYSKELAKKYISQLPTEQAEYLSFFLKANPGFITRYGTFPFLKNNIYVAGYEVIFKGEGVSYILENRWNELLEEGQGYAGSTIVPNTKLNFSYGKDFLEAEQLQTNITLDKYDRVATGEVSEIAGYAVEKIIYTRKPSVISGERILPKSVIAYSSKSFNPVINKVMPYWVAEEQGILKLEVELSESEHSIQMIYQASMAVKRKLIEDETSILATKAFVLIKENKDFSSFNVSIAKIVVPPSL